MAQRRLGCVEVAGADAQAASPLFALPGEIRDRIFGYALSSFEDRADTAVAYANNTCYRRPGYSAPQRVFASLLRTCRRAYAEAWWRPWAQSLVTMYLTEGRRRPQRVTTVGELASNLARVGALHGGEAPEIEHVRVFAQMYMLEPGRELQGILNVPQFRPRCVTLTLRHTDWWFWEDDEPLRIAAPFVNLCRFPASVREIRLELESLERKRSQIDYVAGEMQRHWRFQRTDGVRLAAENQAMEAMNWTGSSTWNGERWIRDEVRPGQLDYYVKTVSFRPVAFTSSEPADVQSRRSFAPQSYVSPNITVGAVQRINHEVNKLAVREMESAGVPVDSTADEALAMVRLAAAAAQQRIMEHAAAAQQQLREDDPAVSQRSVRERTRQQRRRTRR
ncbi:hypothetical protein HK405_003344 [Cladochytrium tenue]|nr:hypothetical protein HK405_003344 [Cladochytrium tenue]